MDKIYLNKMEFYAYHGVFSEENKMGQRFYVDLVLEADLQPSATDDDLEKSVNYADGYQLVKEVIENNTFNLVETIAETISTEVFAQFQIVERLTVKVTKPDPPIPGHYESVAIEITRERK
ncbi:dihydroneopterin aldolase [Salsuginibacillus kocurii]|uniref:dihydroneopterin aldolase n=1 Tax=Salsuginibacillus kocurii TaxID=427078 RepID=UPI00035EDA89|nr:dihydroneopterin aldolase [Salsuginibacillus kocurii]